MRAIFGIFNVIKNFKATKSILICEYKDKIATSFAECPINLNDHLELFRNMTLLMVEAKIKLIRFSAKVYVCLESNND